MIVEIIQLQEGISNATMTAYIQNVSRDFLMTWKKPAIIICPGGAYISITEKETEPVALKFLSAGYQVFVLQYSIGTECARFPAPFIDVAKAVMLVRENAGRWGIDSDNISLCGFSTGGHVAATFAASWQESYLSKALNADNQLFKPNALVLCYPLLDVLQFKLRNSEKSQEMKTLMEMMFRAVFGTENPGKEQMDEWDCKKRITSNMPPTFLWTTSEDVIVDIEGSLDFIKALAVNKIPYEYHVFEKGSHGMSLGDQTVGYSEVDKSNFGNAAKWIELVIQWLEQKSPA